MLKLVADHAERWLVWWMAIAVAASDESLGEGIEKGRCLRQGWWQRMWAATAAAAAACHQLGVCSPPWVRKPSVPAVVQDAYAAHMAEKQALYIGWRIAGMYGLDQGLCGKSWRQEPL